ncbi:MAG: hypothetical protein ACFE9T_15890 [Promethearchaeota archaeon]
MNIGKSMVFGFSVLICLCIVIGIVEVIQIILLIKMYGILLINI